jgi:hypothetical protein
MMQLSILILVRLCFQNTMRSLIEHERDLSHLLQTARIGVGTGKA